MLDSLAEGEYDWGFRGGEGVLNRDGAFFL